MLYNVVFFFQFAILLLCQCVCRSEAEFFLKKIIIFIFNPASHAWARAHKFSDQTNWFCDLRCHTLCAHAIAWVHCVCWVMLLDDVLCTMLSVDSLVSWCRDTLDPRLAAAVWIIYEKHNHNLVTYSLCTATCTTYNWCRCLFIQSMLLCTRAMQRGGVERNSLWFQGLF